jgi:hypothetical protein
MPVWGKRNAPVVIPNLPTAGSTVIGDSDLIPLIPRLLACQWPPPPSPGPFVIGHDGAHVNTFQR